MEELLAALDRIAHHLHLLNYKSVKLLRSPLPARDRDTIWRKLPFSPTRELDMIYQWRDGTEAREGVLLEELWFFPGFYFLSMEEAEATYKERVGAPQWRDNWFPLFADGAGDFYVIPCQRTSTDTSGVIGFIHGEPEQIVEYESLTAMMATIAQAYAERAIFVDSDGTLEFDDERYKRIANALNPEIEVWQD
jgi:hypothetical protein